MRSIIQGTDSLRHVAGGVLSLLERGLRAVEVLAPATGDERTAQPTWVRAGETAGGPRPSSLSAVAAQPAAVSGARRAASAASSSALADRRAEESGRLGWVDERRSSCCRSHALPNGAQHEQSANGPAPAYGVEEVGGHYGLVNISRRSVDYVDYP
jgi:hypothetical protein